MIRYISNQFSNINIYKIKKSIYIERKAGFL